LWEKRWKREKKKQSLKGEWVKGRRALCWEIWGKGEGNFTNEILKREPSSFKKNDISEGERREKEKWQSQRAPALQPGGGEGIGNERTVRRGRALMCRITGLWKGGPGYVFFGGGRAKDLGHQHIKMAIRR